MHSHLGHSQARRLCCVLRDTHGITNQAEWHAAYNANKPYMRLMPRSPDTAYKDWVSWDHFLTVRRASCKNVAFYAAIKNARTPSAWRRQLRRLRQTKPPGWHAYCAA